MNKLNLAAIALCSGHYFSLFTKSFDGKEGVICDAQPIHTLTVRFRGKVDTLSFSTLDAERVS